MRVAARLSCGAWGPLNPPLLQRSRHAAVAAPAALSSIPANAPDSSAMEAHVPGFLRWLAHCNTGAEAVQAGGLVPFLVDGQSVGYLRSRWDSPTWYAAC